MLVRILSVLVAAAVAAVFLLPSTMALYAAVNGTAWDLQDLQDLDAFPSQLLGPAVSAFFVATSPVRLAIALRADATHPIAHVPLFELDCALLR